MRNQIVARFKDNRLLKGFTHDFSPIKEIFHLTDESGVIHDVRCSDLKAIFFVKTLTGNKDYSEKKKFEEVDASGLRGLKIKVEFNDGEVIRGVSSGYSKNRKGFFVIPVDPDSNNERIYVIADAVSDVKVGSAAES